MGFAPKVKGKEQCIYCGHFFKDLATHQALKYGLTTKLIFVEEYKINTGGEP